VVVDTGEDFIIKKPEEEQKVQEELIDLTEKKNL